MLSSKCYNSLKNYELNITNYELKAKTFFSNSLFREFIISKYQSCSNNVVIYTCNVTKAFNCTCILSFVKVNKYSVLNQKRPPEGT